MWQSASSLQFSTSSRTRTVTYTNNTGAKVTFIRASMSSARYMQTNNCGEVLPGKSCSVTITYYPGNSGPDSGTFTMTSTAPNSPHTVALATGSTQTAGSAASPFVRGTVPVRFRFPGWEDRR